MISSSSECGRIDEHEKKPSDLAEIARKLLLQAKEAGATDASVQINRGQQLDISVRNQELENLNQHRQQHVSLTVWFNDKCGHAASTSLSPEAGKRLVESASLLARYGTEDTSDTLPDDRRIPDFSHDLCLNAPWLLDVNDATALALETANAIDSQDSHCQCESAGITSWQGDFWLSDSRGFSAGYPSTVHTLWAAALAQNNQGRVLDSKQSSQRYASDLQSAANLGAQVAVKALMQLGAEKLKTRRCAALFDATIAPDILSACIRALSGEQLWQGASFLGLCLEQQIFPEYIQLMENPFTPRGMASRYFDSEGCVPEPRHIIKDGHVTGYFLSNRSARKLGMKSTGNAGGVHNLTFKDRRIQIPNSTESMLASLGTGLWVTGLLGDGLNPVTGDYSQGVNGFWVENGQVCYPVDEITLSTNLRTLFSELVMVGNDVQTQNGWSCGSLLVPDVLIAGY